MELEQKQKMSSGHNQHLTFCLCIIIIIIMAGFLLVEPPLFVRCLESKDAVKGTELMLEGQVSGSAPFTVSMYKNTKPIRNDKRHRITVKDDLIALQVLAVEAGDVGMYQCTVENEVGRASCDCQVTLKGSYGCSGAARCFTIKNMCFRFSGHLVLDPLTKLTRGSHFFLLLNLSENLLMYLISVILWPRNALCISEFKWKAF